MADHFIAVEVAYAEPDQQYVIPVNAPSSVTVEQVIHLSGILQKCQGIDLASLQVGIFGKVCQLDQKLEENDRVEIYRPLLVDPKQARRIRAKK